MRGAAHFGFTQQLLELGLWEEAVVLHEGRDLGGPLALVVHSAMDLHVFVQEAQKLLLALNETEAMAALFWRSRARVRRGEAAVRGSVLGGHQGL